MTSLFGSLIKKQLKKLRITPVKPTDILPFEVQFNPAHYSISKTVSWGAPTPPAASSGSGPAQTTRNLNAPLLEYKGGQARTLSLQLFFDVTEHPEVDGKPVTDVRKLTNKFVELTRKQRKGDKDQPPPVCEIEWGGNKLDDLNFPIRGVVTSLTQDFVFFDSDGTPLRANLSVTFTELLIAKEDQLQTDPEFTTRAVKRGDTLSAIAADMYDDASLWRIIADANRLDDPRRLAPGRVLRIPKIR